MTTRPDSLVLQAVKAAVARHLEIDPADVIDDLDLREHLGLDALDLVLIVTRVEEELGVEISLPRLDFVRSVSDLTLVIEDEDEPPTLRDPGVWGADPAHPA